MARPLRTKSSETMAKALLSIFYENSFFPAIISSDEGTEMNNQVLKKLCENTAISHILNHFMTKNANMVESAHSRIVNLLRRELNNSDSWPESIAKTCFALNNCSKLYGPNNYIATPAYIFNTRDLTSAPTTANIEESKKEADTDVKTLIRDISKHNLIDTPSLYINIQNRRPAYSLNETVLAFAEFVIGKKKLGRGLVKTKLKQFWVKAKIVKKLGQNYILKLPNGTEKRYHERQIKKYNLDDIESDDQETQSFELDSP